MQPIIIQDAISIAANSINQNVIASNASLRNLLQLSAPSRLLLAMVQSATGLEMEFNCGAENLVANSNGRVSASTPEIPLDIVNADGYGEEGNILSLRAANTTGGAITLRYIIVAQPLAMPGQRVQLPPNVRVMQQGPIVVANGAVDQQLLDGLRYERSRVDSILEILMTASATGMTRKVFIDAEQIAPPSTISIANRIPQDPFDATVSDIEAPARELIQLAITNQSGGNLNVFWKTKLQEMVR